MIPVSLDKISDIIRVGMLIHDLDEQLESMDNRYMMKHYTHEFKLFQKCKTELELYLKKLSES